MQQVFSCDKGSFHVNICLFDPDFLPEIHFQQSNSFRIPHVLCVKQDACMVKRDFPALGACTSDRQGNASAAFFQVCFQFCRYAPNIDK